MAWSSTVPAALTALYAAFKAAPGLADADVRDGPMVTGSNAAQAVIVGWYGATSDYLAVEGQDAPEGLAGLPDREKYTVRCAAMARMGTGDNAGARAAACQLLAACGAAVAADRTLGGVVMRAYVGASSLRQVPDQNGVTATVEFAVDCDGYTGR